MKGLVLVGAFLISLGVYFGLPYELWHWLAPVAFWQKVVVVAGIGIYEWFTFWLGLLAWGFLVTTMVD
jgi:hypothetical protein